VRLGRDRASLVLLGLVVLGALLLAGVLLAVFLGRGGGEAAPTTAASGSQTLPPPTRPATTTATTPPAPPGPLRPVAVGPFAATVEWVGGSPPARVAYGLPELGPTL
jgi:hypothetical protein